MTTLEVWTEQDGRTRIVGQAHFTRMRGQVSTTFIYDAGYLADGGINIDPGLQLTSGSQHQSGLLRAFADSAPDRWGRNLIEKAERVRAREDGRTPRSLDDVDFLLGVSDDTRQGALRFGLPGHEEYVGRPSSVPRLISLPLLLRASDELASDADPSNAVKQLLDTGTTGLGGARPKASVRLEDGALAIAKFPHSSDQWDVMAWEATALDLLENAGLRTPWRRLVSVSDRSVLLVRRFDRTATGVRVGYISAMTATGASDGDRRDYSDIVEAIRDISVSSQADQRELYDRAVASVALGNTDDHLRNHGFLAAGGLWTLSPAFDVNPNPDLSKPRATSIAGADLPADEVEGLLALADDADIGADEARDRIAHVATSLAGWRDHARRHGIAERELTMMADAIEPRLHAVAHAGRW
ncbi:type II toxin-antitoxin system HipA family toxin [Demequina sp.]|uniref:type II toxin-antitoxin system HipA family toxin n=1 Tax=Demequina sp. TaxID=2050685 RepID=UPI0025B81942|nr:type II toxin-antitoxin system HipA family toxin [Demequina sp.]